jgi:hypothetical protein
LDKETMAAQGHQVAAVAAAVLTLLAHLRVEIQVALVVMDHQIQLLVHQ